MDKLYSISKTAEILDVTPKTLRIWDKENKLKPVLTSGGHRRYKESDLNEFMGGNKTIDEFIENAWNWIEPYFVAQKVCNESINALKELFNNAMRRPHRTKSIYN